MFAHSLKIKQFYLTYRYDPIKCYHITKAIKKYSTFHKIPGLEPHYQMQFIVISRTLVGSVLPLYRDAVSIFYIPSQLGWTLTSTTTPGQSGLESNGHEGVLHVSQSSRTRASSSDGLVSYPGHLLGGWVLLLCRNAVGVFYSPSWLGWKHL